MDCKRTSIRKPHSIAAALAVALLIAPAAFGQKTKPKADTAPAKAAAANPVAREISVAVITFDSNTPGAPDLGQQIADVLSASLSGEPGFAMVDRTQMSNVLRENELNLSGLVNGDQANKIGKIVGARILITGKAFTVDKQVFVTAKLVGTETTLVEGIVVKGAKEADTAELIMQLAEKVSERLRTTGGKLVAADDAVADPLPRLTKALAGRALPKLAIAIRERHITGGAGIDPAVDTEIKKTLIAAGFTVIDGSERDWDKGGVAVAITGEAFSEFNARIGNLVSCSARSEIKAVERDGGKLLFADRTTTRAVDLAENTAGKSALQKGGREIAIKLLEHFVETLPPAK